MSMKFAGSNKRLPVAKHLTDIQYTQLIETHIIHNRAMGLDYRDKYGLHNIVKVVAMPTGNLQVFFADGEWWNYSSSRNWH